MATTTSQKVFGAFYTGEPVARTIVKWAVRGKGDSVLDPACGDGVFLFCAAQHLESMGSDRPQVWGIDVDDSALRAAKERAPQSRLVGADFFSTVPGDIPSFTAVIGNPPFIRYQTFKGSARSAALTRAEEAGVRLPALSSSWAPFLVHAVAFLRKGGRLGMVVPAELGHAQYAREVLNFLLGNFGQIQFCIFRKKLFPNLSEDTGILFCEEFQRPCARLTVAVLDDIEEAEEQGYTERPVDIEALRAGRTRLGHYLLSPVTRCLYERLAEHPRVVRLGQVADVGIGYVSGHNDYFHLSLHERGRWRIPSGYLRPALLSLNDCGGIVVRGADWQRLAREGRKSYLLAIPPIGDGRLPRGVLNYLRHGEDLGTPSRFKCRVREPWYSVPHVRVADAFLSYMSGRGPRLVGNRYSLVAPNTLHLVRFDRGSCPDVYTAGWYSSLTSLSCELEGHALGGGMLKLEPSEAEKVLVPVPRPAEAGRMISRADILFRRKETGAAAELVDSRVLRSRLGLTATECALLRDAAAQMRGWRMHK